MLEYLRPDNLEDALLTLTEQPCTLLAGGTDFYPARVGKKITENVLDLSGIRGLRSIQETVKEVMVYDKGCSTYDLPRNVVEEIGLPLSASHPQDVTHYMGLYFMASRGAQLVESVQI